MTGFVVLDDLAFALLNSEPLFGQKVGRGYSSQDQSNHIGHGPITHRNQNSCPSLGLAEGRSIPGLLEIGDAYSSLL